MTFTVEMYADVSSNLIEAETRTDFCDSCNMQVDILLGVHF